MHCYNHNNYDTILEILHVHTQTAGTHYTPLVADPSMVLISTVTVLAEGALNTTVNMADMPSLTLYTTGSNSITTSVDERGGGKSSK